MLGEAYAAGMDSVKHFLPPDFPKPASFWAAYFQVDVRTIRDWTERYSIPYHLAGRERYISPAAFVTHLPFIQPGKTSADQEE